MIDTIEQRSVTSYLVSGTVFSAVFGGSMSYDRYQKGEISGSDALLETSRLAVQGGIAASSAVWCANALGQRDYLGAMLGVGAGFLGVYAAQKAAEKIERTIKKKEENDGE
ncbi:hypothetical protein [Hydrogenimonas sp.]|uniref:hypothetical protein n=1 Tax=Hydrogenimonas sp. TaxID=2231112 RepID=UPI0026357578|nr:hypothetical protein [Hydrogenimonas sp.]